MSKKKIEINLTFIEIERIYKLVQQKIKKHDYGVAPCVSILIEPYDAEAQTVKVCSIHDITKELMQSEEEGRKPNILSVYKDVTDLEKLEYI